MENQDTNTTEQNGNIQKEPAVQSEDIGIKKEDNSSGAQQSYYQELIGIEELFNKTLAILKASLGKIVSLVLIPILGYILTAILGFATVYVAGLENLGMVSFAIGIITALAAVASIVLAFLAQAAVYLLIRDVSSQPRILELFEKAKAHVLSFILISFLVGFFTFLWSLLFIIPGIIAATRYSLAPWVYFYEGLKGRAAIKRSKELVKGYTGSVFGRYALLYLFYFLISYIPLLILNLVNAPEIMIGIWNVINQVLAFVVGPFYLIYSCYIYWDLKRIKGGKTTV
jgi:uncharacterized membrane protein